LLARAVQRFDGLYDARVSLLKVPWAGPGYHTRVPNGSLVHPFRESLDCALVYLESETPELKDRALKILEATLAHQDLRLCSPTYGIWSYLLEEPLEKMSPPDWNWADFCGIRLAHILCAHGSALPVSLGARIVHALKAVALSIFRRNVGPGYTNIAIKGAVVSALVGRLTNETFLMDYAEQRLEAFLRHCRASGGFSEYNSPPYGEVVLHEIERGVLLLSEGPIKERLLEIHEFFWRGIAETLHLPTGQLCGPQSRAYKECLTPDYAATLARRLGFPIRQPGTKKSAKTGAEILPDLSFLTPAVPCPVEIRDRLANFLPSFTRPGYVQSADPYAARVAAVWQAEEACLGSIGYENLWTQRRPVLGYWLVEGELAVLRVRMRQGGRDFASGTLRTVQQGASLLGLASLATNKGDFHDHMDRPAQGVFHLSNLELVIQVEAPGARALTDGNGFTISAGSWCVVVRTGPARFGGFSVRWESRQTKAGAEVRAIVQEGSAIVINPAELASCVIPFSLNLCSTRKCTALEFETQFPEGKVALSARAPELRLEAPRTAGPVRDHFTR
jgi:hypothetical protein